MKRHAYNLLTFAIALLPLAGWSATVTTTQTQAQPSTAVDSTARLSQPVREVVKMTASGVPDEVVKAYVENSGSTFNLTTDNIIHLQGLGVSSTVTTAMLVHDKNLRESVNAQAQAAQAVAIQQQNEQNAQAAATAMVAQQNYQNQYSAPSPQENYYSSDVVPYSQPYYYSPGYDWWAPSVGIGFPFGSRGFERFHHGGFGFRSEFNHGFGRGFHGGFNGGFRGSGGFHGGMTHTGGGFHGSGLHGGGHR
jgi:hypothetical protein